MNSSRNTLAFGLQAVSWTQIVPLGRSWLAIGVSEFHILAGGKLEQLQ